MDFNMKKLASDAGIFFTRAVQVRPCALGLAARMWGGPGAPLRENRGVAQEKPLEAAAPSRLRDTLALTSPTAALPRRKSPGRPATLAAHSA